MKSLILNLFLAINGTLSVTFKLKHVLHSAYSADNQPLFYKNTHSVPPLELDVHDVQVSETQISPWSHMSVKNAQKDPLLIQSNGAKEINAFVKSREIIMPDPKDPKTVLALAKMTYNSYYEPEDKNWINVPGWGVVWIFV